MYVGGLSLVSFCLVILNLINQKDFFVLLNMKKCYSFLAKLDILYEICTVKNNYNIKTLKYITEEE